MSTIRTRAGLVVATTLLLAACGGSSGSTPAGTIGTAGSTAASAASTAVPSGLASAASALAAALDRFRCQREPGRGQQGEREHRHRGRDRRRAGCRRRLQRRALGARGRRIPALRRRPDVAHLRQELSKYNIDQATFDKIIGVLEV